MVIYISHSKNFDYRKELYQSIQQADIFKKHQFIFPHLTGNKPYPTKDLFESGKCNLVVAEVSFPATGQGIELGWADLLGIPVFCVYKKGSAFSQSLNMVSYIFIEYATSQELISKLVDELEKMNDVKA